MKTEDIAYIFDHAEVDSIIVDAEFVPLLDSFRKSHPNVHLIVDPDTDATEGELSGPFDEAVLEGLTHDRDTGARGWKDLEHTATDENALIALAYTSGTTAKPKVRRLTHRSR